MKTTTLLAAFASVLLAGCAGTGKVTVQTPVVPKQPVPESSDIERGKEHEWRAPVSVENLQMFDDEMLADFRKNVIEPLSKGSYRYTIDSIRLAASPDMDREWDLLIGLDNGAAIRVEHFVEWNESRQTYFSSGYRRALAGLEKARHADPVLNRYVTYWSKPPTKKKTPEQKLETKIAQVAQTGNSRPQD
jgi:hypothetical protein